MNGDLHGNARVVRHGRAALVLLLAGACAAPPPVAVSPAPEPAGAAPVHRTILADAPPGAYVSPDGRWIAFVDRETGKVAVRDRVSGETREVQGAGGPDAAPGWAVAPLRFSPDGQQVVFGFANARAADPFRYELRIAGVGGGPGERVLLAFEPDVAQVAPLDWHAQHGVLFLLAGADGGWQLRVVNPRTGAVATLVRGRPGSPAPGQALFSPAGGHLLYLVDGLLIQQALAEGITMERRLAAGVLLGWSWDGERLLLHGGTGRDAGIWSIAAPFSAGGPGPDLVYRTAPGLLPAGRTDQGMHYLEPVEYPKILLGEFNLAAASPAPPQPIVAAAAAWPANPAWSPDGRYLAYSLADQQRDSHGIVVLDMLEDRHDETDRLELKFMSGLGWSADQRYLVMGGQGRSRDTSWIGRTRLATGEFELREVQLSTAVAPGPGQQIVYVRAAAAGEKAAVVLMPGVGEPGRVLATYPVSETPGSVSMSPDGRRIAVLKPADRYRASELQILPVDGGPPVTVLRRESPAALAVDQGSIPWTADGGRVVVLVNNDGARQFFAVDVATGAMTATGIVSGPGRRQHPALHPGGERLAWASGAVRRELRLMPGDARQLMSDHPPY